jgi:hypothetical protein
MAGFQMTINGRFWVTTEAFVGLRIDAAMSKEVLQAISGNAIQAALEAAEQMQQKRRDLRQAIELELEQARHEVFCFLQNGIP